ncbi:hypothetical protein SNEBB_007295 [Seison nebaliae]|nr:hypothetical protein SNEBB_007295 [Seison nebaliae]
MIKSEMPRQFEEKIKMIKEKSTMEDRTFNEIMQTNNRLKKNLGKFTNSLNQNEKNNNSLNVNQLETDKVSRSCEIVRKPSGPTEENEPETNTSSHFIKSTHTSRNNLYATERKIWAKLSENIPKTEINWAVYDTNLASTSVTISKCDENIPRMRNEQTNDSPTLLQRSLSDKAVRRSNVQNTSEEGAFGNSLNTPHRYGQCSLKVKNNRCLSPLMTRIDSNQLSGNKRTTPNISPNSSFKRSRGSKRSSRNSNSSSDDDSQINMIHINPEYIGGSTSPTTIPDRLIKFTKSNEEENEQKKLSPSTVYGSSTFCNTPSITKISLTNINEPVSTNTNGIKQKMNNDNNSENRLKDEIGQQKHVEHQTDSNFQKYDLGKRKTDSSFDDIDEECTNGNNEFQPKYKSLGNVKGIGREDLSPNDNYQDQSSLIEFSINSMNLSPANNSTISNQSNMNSEQDLSPFNSPFSKKSSESPSNFMSSASPSHLTSVNSIMMNNGNRNSNNNNNNNNNMMMNNDNEKKKSDNSLNFLSTDMNMNVIDNRNKNSFFSSNSTNNILSPSNNGSNKSSQLFSDNYSESFASNIDCTQFNNSSTTFGSIPKINEPIDTPQSIFSTEKKKLSDLINNDNPLNGNFSTWRNSQESNILNDNDNSFEKNLLFNENNLFNEEPNDLFLPFPQISNFDNNDFEDDIAIQQNSNLEKQFRSEKL